MAFDRHEQNVAGYCRVDCQACEINRLTKVLTPAEAAYGLVAWLTTLPTTIELGASCDSAPAAELLQHFCDVHELGDVRPSWPEGLRRA